MWQHQMKKVTWQRQKEKTNGIFLLNARPKLGSNLNLNSKFVINSQ